MRNEKVHRLLDEWIADAKSLFGSVTVVNMENVFRPDGCSCIKVTPISLNDSEKRGVSSMKKAKKQTKKIYEMKGLFEDEHGIRTNGL